MAAGKLRPDPRRKTVSCDFQELLSRTAFGDETTLHAGVSGGADSLAMVVLARMSGRRVIAHHVDHGLRPGSREEGAYVARLLHPWGVPVVEHRVVVDSTRNVEDRARRARQAVLGDAARGHTQDDQAETVLINLLRGAGPAGLSAMQQGPLHPILALRRYETEAVCREVGLLPFRDPSNSDPRFVRNRIRAELLPLASQIAGRDVIPLIARTASVVRAFSENTVSLACETALCDLESAGDVQLWQWAGEYLRERCGLGLSLAHRQGVAEVIKGSKRAHALPLGFRIIRRSCGVEVVSSTGEVRASIN